MNHWLNSLDITQEELQSALRVPDPAQLLVRELGHPAPLVLEAIADHYQCAWLSLSHYRPECHTVRLLSELQARKLGALPLFQIENRLYLAVSNPGDMKVLDFVSALTGKLIEPVAALSDDIDEAINRHLVTREESTRTLQAIKDTMSVDSRVGEVAYLENRENPIIRLVDHVLSQAVRLGASDLHLEPYADHVCLRYRIDGVLREFPAPPKSAYAGVVSRIKITSGMDIAERRLPQDGRSSLVVDDQRLDLRVSVIPGVHGEGIVVRILNSQSGQLDLHQLGFEPDLLERYQSILTRPNGIVLVTGPTGAGKSTTLYATLKHVRTPTKKAITLEDPVEYQLEGVQQIQVYPEIGYTFAQGLRAILRHDPDIILVGEMRDLESAQIAIRAALTGHQIFSTLHTNSAAQALTRLSDMGLPLYQVLASLNGVLGQRLVRRLCPNCRSASVNPRPAKSGGHFATLLGAHTELFEPVGCSQCNQIGYKGRLAVYELLDLQPGAIDFPSGPLPEREIIRLAEAQGAYFSLKQSLASKVAGGITSLSEAISLIGQD